MKNSFQDVVDFHRGIKAPVGDPTAIDCTIDIALRVKLIAEEFDELLGALCPRFGESQFVTDAVEEWLKERVALGGETDPVEAADALADMCVVTIGSAVAWGIPLPEVWNEVHHSNMAKLGGPVREDGKQLKPKNWTPPDIVGVLRRVADNTRLSRTQICTRHNRCGVCHDVRTGGGCGGPLNSDEPPSSEG